MRDRCWPGLAVLLAVLLGAFSAAGQENQKFMVGGGGSSGDGTGFNISSSHSYLVVGEPGFTFGLIQKPKEEWKLYYLVLIKHNATAKSTYERDSLGNDLGATYTRNRMKSFTETLSLDGNKLAFAYKAEIDKGKPAILGEELTFLDKKIDLTNGRVFLVDMTRAPVSFKQVNAKLPSSKGFDFLKDTSQYQKVTKRWLKELSKESESVRMFFEK